MQPTVEAACSGNDWFPRAVSLREIFEAIPVADMRVVREGFSPFIMEKEFKSGAGQAARSSDRQLYDSPEILSHVVLPRSSFSVVSRLVVMMAT